MSNEDDQSDEIMALRSIYEENVFNCNSEEKPFSGIIYIDVDVGFESYDFICNGDLISFKHLSSIIMSFSLPPSYPYESPPDINLACLWLTTEQLDNLSNILKDKWKESCGVILYRWMDLLKSEIFNLLDTKFPLEISEERVLKMTEINLIKEEEALRNAFHFCPICFLEVSGGNCIQMSGCGHILCKECLRGFLSLYISDGNVNSLICPAEKCEEQIFPHVVKSLVSESEFERYERLLFHKTLSVMPDVQYCPRTNCGEPAIVEDENDRLAFCHACNFAFCIKCNSTYHGVDLCKNEKASSSRRALTEQEEEEIEQESEMNDLEKDEDFWATYRHDMKRKLAAEKLQEMISIAKRDGSAIPRRLNAVQKQQIDEQVKRCFEEGSDYVEELMVSRRRKLGNAMNRLWMENNSKRCPKCRSSIQKISGCNMMFCQICRSHFCWACLTTFKVHSGHFSCSGSSLY